MSDLDALFRAVLDRPDDDTPRLVYADALDDLGAADRAAFVRGQVEAARAAPWEPAAVRHRCYGGDVPPGRDWRRDLPPLPAGLGWVLPPYRRGFPAVVQADDGAAFAAAAEHLFELAPVEELELTALPAGDVAALAACPGLAQIKRLVVRAGLGQATARGLLDSPHLTALDDLVIGAGLTSAQTARAVVASPAFRRLLAFSYRDEERGGALVAALAGLADPPPLRSLDLQGNRLSADGLRRLLDAPVAAGLECLDVGDNNLGADGFRELVGGDRLPALRRLDAVQIGLGSAGVSELGGSALAGRVRYLNLGGNALARNVGAALGSMDLPELRVLDLGDNGLGDLGVTHLLRGRWVSGLVHLDLAENNVDAAGAEALTRAPELDGLVALDLRRNPVPPSARKRLWERFGERVLL
ncbi:MAG TPA: TIGR02996 domain-containing protein [Urbifossiella sp.]|nr:TIGR02996 domain-containing protein [Urbifossiella sp.]